MLLSQTTSNSDVTFSPPSLTFTPLNWNIQQTVIVSAAEDDGGDDDTATLRLRDLNINQYDTSVSITVKDDDTTAGFVLSGKALTVVEGDTTGATFNMALATEPSGQVTVSFTADGANKDDVELSTNSHTFTDANWNTVQPVTVTVDSDTLSSDGAADIDVTASGGGYDDVTGEVSVKLKDSGAADLAFPASLSIEEGGNGTFMVRLTQVPDDSVTVTLSQSGTTNNDVTFDTDSDDSGNQDELTFTTTDWNTAQPVIVSAAEDNDAIEDTATISLGASGGGYGSTTGSVSITVNDNDTAGFEISKKNLSLTEDDSDTFTVQLTTKPSVSVTVTLAQPTNTDVTLDTDTDTTNNQNTLTFTTANWETAQTVTVTAADDSDEAPGAATINLTAAGGDYASVISSVSVSVADKDITLNTDDSMEPNEGVITNLGVRLSDKPSHNIYVRSRMGSGSADVTRASASEYLVFTPENWETDQQIGIAVAEDPDAVDEIASTLILSASGFGYDIDEKRVTINSLA
ncbi:MAG: hypothetical protein ISN28_09220 [Ectothiorhodospiraceae bacterium AqS1]|nr:hypothetical protein [Ectothiorhodospiraceae bacterium AqS1]